MKKKSKRLSKHLKPIKLYFDDLERIIDALRDVSSDISVSTDEYELADITDLRSLNQEAVHELEISVNHRDVVVEFSESDARIYGYDTPICIGVVEKIKQQLKPRSLKFGWLAYNSVVFAINATIAIMGILAGLAWSISSFRSRNLEGSIGGALIVTILAAFSAWLWRLALKNYSTIYLRTKKEMPGFVARKKDDIVLAIISGLLGAILGAVAALAISHFAAK